MLPCRSMPLLSIVVSALLVGQVLSKKASFSIADDRFVLDGEPLQIISGSIHYFRVPPEYWEDRLVRLKVLGLNTVQIYVPWNMHEPSPGLLLWSDGLDIAKFLAIAQKVGLWVTLRAGPYICAEWEAGGIPWWLGSTKVTGGRSMRLRSDDPNWLRHVDRWWDILLPKVAPFMHSRGGPILMVQVENEYGYCGSSKVYLRNLIAKVKALLGKETVVFTTDPPYNVAKGSIAGDEVYTVVDFGPAANADVAFAMQQRMNPKGKSPPFCSEFYTGWLTAWGQPMANTSAEQMTSAFTKILKYANGTGSVNLYMAHGGTNFGFWAGGGLGGTQYFPQITSYDYSAPLSEQGRQGQPGIGGPNKYKMLQHAISEHTGKEAQTWPTSLTSKAYGTADIEQQAYLLHAVDQLFPGEGIPSRDPVNMEEYGQGRGFILYQADIAAASLRDGAVLDFGGPVHDYAHVFLGDELVGRLDRSHPRRLPLPAWQFDVPAKLSVLLHAMGRDDAGCSFDLKGLVARVTLDGNSVEQWRTFPLPLDSLGKVEWQEGTNATGLLQDLKADQPVFLRGSFNVESGTLRSSAGYLPDTFLALNEWGKGLAWVNGFNLGWYWPSIGPQNHYYVPGTLLREGANEVVLLELEAVPDGRQVRLAAEADLRGPSHSRPVTS